MLAIIVVVFILIWSNEYIFHEKSMFCYLHVLYAYIQLYSAGLNFDRRLVKYKHIMSLFVLI